MNILYKIAILQMLYASQAQRSSLTQNSTDTGSETEPKPEIKVTTNPEATKVEVPTSTSVGGPSDQKKELGKTGQNSDLLGKLDKRRDVLVVAKNANMEMLKDKLGADFSLFDETNTIVVSDLIAPAIVRIIG